MTCLRCHCSISAGDAACADCGFSLEALDGQFGSDGVEFSRITDATNRLLPEEIAAIAKLLDRFEATFPQLFLAVYSGELPASTSVREFGFWLLNRGTVVELETGRPNASGLVLVVNTSTGSAALVAGYFVELLLLDAEFHAVLQSAQSAFNAGEVAAGVQAVIRSLTASLVGKARAAARQAGKQNPSRELSGQTATAPESAEVQP